MAAALLGFDIRRLGRDDMREFLRIAGTNIFDILEESFESPQLKGALALDAVLGTNLGPRSNNSILTLLHRLSGNSAPGLPLGGMGAVTAAIAASAEKAGAAGPWAAAVREREFRKASARSRIRPRVSPALSAGLPRRAIRS